MAMVDIKRGADRFKVSKKTFENIYKPRGFRIVSDKKNTHDINNRSESLVDIPISDMNKEQLADFAKAHNIDTTGAKSVSEARKIIQKAIQQSRM